MNEMVLCEKVSKKLGSYQLKDICFALDVAASEWKSEKASG